MGKPKLVFFFDEAHRVFDGASSAFHDQVQTVIRLIRSKGVGVYYVTQSPKDIPADVLGQLGNLVSPALRAFTPRDQKAVKSAAETFRQNPKLNVENVLTELAVGEALVSMLDENGSPEIVERAKIVPPRSQIGAITPDQRKQIISSSGLADRYKADERPSAYERLQPAAQEIAASAPASALGAPPSAQTKPSRLDEALGTAKAALEPRIGPRGGHYDSVATTAIKSVARFAQSQAGQQLIRGLFRNLIRVPSRSKADKS